MDIQRFKAEVKLNIFEAKMLYNVYLEILNITNNDVKYGVLKNISLLQYTIDELSANLSKLEEIEEELLEKLNKHKLH